MQREGYLFVDHRASPGLPEGFARAMGMDPALCREGKLFEAATLTCAHCKTTVVKEPRRTRERGQCMKCGDKYLCDGCAFEARMPDYDHTPFEKKVDLAKNAEARLGSPPMLLQAKG